MDFTGGRMEANMKALITGITGQDGSYLAEFLISRGYEVHGITRSGSEDNHQRIADFCNQVTLHRIDLPDQLSLIKIIEEVNPDEIYNLAALNQPEEGWDQPWLCGQVNAFATICLLEAIRLVKPDARYFQASSYTIFGQPAESPQTEKTAIRPVTPLGAAKAFAHQMTVSYRERYGLKASTAILYDHESPRRNTRFLTRCITRAAAQIKQGLQSSLDLDTINISRDWGHAADYVRSFWMMLQNPAPDDFIIATGQSHSLKDFCRTAFAAVDLDWRDYVRVNGQSYPAANGAPLKGNTAHARRRLLWEPEISFEAMIEEMVVADMPAALPNMAEDLTAVPVVNRLDREKVRI